MNLQNVNKFGSLFLILISVAEIDGRRCHGNIHKFAVTVIEQTMNISVRKSDHIPRRECLFLSVCTSVTVTLTLDEFSGFKCCLETTPGFDNSVIESLPINSMMKKFF